jgi:hypothetical protein
MEDLDTARAPYHNKHAKALVSCKDAQKYVVEILDEEKHMIGELDQIKHVLNTGRPVTNEVLDNWLEVLSKIRLQNTALNTKIGYLKNICEDESVNWMVARILYVQHRHSDIRRQIQHSRARLFEDMSNQVFCFQ